MQYLLSIFLLPLIVYCSFALSNRLRIFLGSHPVVATTINTGAFLLLLLFALKLSTQKLLYLDGKTTMYFFANDLLGSYKAIIVALFCLLCMALLLVYRRQEVGLLKSRTTDIISFAIVTAVIADVCLYNVFNLALLQPKIAAESNPVFYSITQVYAGKYLLVDFNAQYGLYAWMLNPVFKLIGLSVYKIGLVFGILNACSFLLIYLGIRKITRNKVLSLMIFLCLIFWQYWQTRMPFGDNPREYYQYWPIRILFPAIAFYLVALYKDASQKSRHIILPVMALSAALGVLWNMDSGIVVFGSVLATLLFSALHLPAREAIKRSAVYISWLFGAMLLVLLVFYLTTRSGCGKWPDLAGLIEFQNAFYISGFFMLPMSAFHFWNVPVLLYIIASTYCARNMHKGYPEDTMMIVFLAILGLGLFSYFLGRSYDTTLNAVMYPAIIIAGVFCDKLLSYIRESKRVFHESSILFFILFLFLSDGALSMIYYTPAISRYSVRNVHKRCVPKELSWARKTDFIAKNIPRRDTVMILSRNFESFYYASGGYMNPMNIGASTELFFKEEQDRIINYIRTTKFPVIYDPFRVLPKDYLKDTLLQTLAEYMTIEKVMPKHELLLLRPGKKRPLPALVPDGNTVYYNVLGEFNRYAKPFQPITLHSDFTIEFVAALDTSLLSKENLLFTNVSAQTPFTGLRMQQSEADMHNYTFTYGNGKEWSGELSCRLHDRADNHIVIRVKDNKVTLYNNDSLCGQTTATTIKNNDEKFYIGQDFAGIVKEMKISNQ